MFDIKKAHEERENLIANIDELKGKLAVIDSDIQHNLKDKIQDAYSKKDEPFGSANFTVDGVKVSVNIPKKVKWDQEKLKTLFFTIINDGGNPDEYIKSKYEVSETAYKSWPSDLSEIFEPARTVEQGALSMKLEVLDA